MAKLKALKKPAPIKGVKTKAKIEAWEKRVAVYNKKKSDRAKAEKAEKTALKRYESKKSKL